MLLKNNCQEQSRKVVYRKSIRISYSLFVLLVTLLLGIFGIPFFGGGIYG